MTVKGDHRLPHLHNRASETFAGPQTSLAWNHIWVPPFGLRASLHTPRPATPATGSVHFGMPGQPSQAGRSAGVGRGGCHPHGPAGERHGERARTRCLGAPQRAAGFRVRIRRTPTPPTYSSRPRRIQLRGRAQTTTPTVPRGSYTSRHAPLRAPAQGACTAIVGRRPGALVRSRGRAQTTIPTMPRGS